MAHKWSGRGWTRLSSDVRFTSEWFVVRRDEARRPDGSVGQYDHVVAPPAVTVLAVDDERRVAVVDPARGQAPLRLAVRVDPLPRDRDCSPEAAARRELVEETGVAAREWTALGSVNGADSLTDHRDHAFLATGLTLGEKRLEAGEADLELHWFPAEQVVGMTLDGLLPHAGSTFAILSAKVRGLL